MLPLTKLEAEVLNAMADDVENLEQIYKAVSLQFFSENYQFDDPRTYGWREREPTVFLSEIADTLVTLMGRGMVSVRLEDDQPYPSGLEYIWRGWFGMTPLGKALWNDHYQSLQD